MNISAASGAAGLPVKTVRYYADIGLVSAPFRSESGYRTYDDRAVRKLVFVRRAREFGFSIDECRELLGLYEDQHRSSADVKRIATKRLEEIARKQRELQSLHDRPWGLRAGVRQGVRHPRTSVRAVVDTGAVMLMLPRNVVERLGAALSGTVIVTYADGRRPTFLRIGSDHHMGASGEETVVSVAVVSAMTHTAVAREGCHPPCAAASRARPRDCGRGRPRSAGHAPRRPGLPARDPRHPRPARRRRESRTTRPPRPSRQSRWPRCPGGPPHRGATGTGSCASPPRDSGRRERASRHATRNQVLMPLMECSGMWQCSIQSPGLSATNAISTVSSASTSSVSRRGPAAPSGETARK